MIKGWSNEEAKEYFNCFPSYRAQLNSDNQPEKASTLKLISAQRPTALKDYGFSKYLF